MPRKHRIHYTHAFYHIMLRGNNRQNIFHEDSDYRNFLDYLQNVTEIYNSFIHLYCLMTNHIHLVIEVTDIPISKVMQSISTKYAKQHNKRYKKIGHVFQGRFKSKLIYDDQYLLELCYYIHMNPVKAGICQAPNDYEWSSHHAYSNHHNRRFITINRLSGLFADFGTTYQLFMEHYKKDVIKSTYCAFNEDGELFIKDSATPEKINKPVLALEHIPVQQIMRIICDYLNVDLDDISSGTRAKRAVLARAMIAYYSHYHAKYTLNDIASFFGLKTDSLSKTMHRYLKQAKSDDHVRKIMEILEGRLSMSDIDKWVL